MRRYRSPLVIFAVLMLTVAPFVGLSVVAGPAAAANVTAPGAIHLGDTVSGHMTIASGSDQYTLSVGAPARAEFHLIGDACSCGWSLTGPNGTVFSQALSNGDVGPTLLVAGSYVLTVTGSGSSTGTYSFSLSAVPAPQSFPISTGSTVADGSPSAGAGNIESPGAEDQYTFSVGGGGGRVYLQYLADNCGCLWSLRSSTGSFEHGFSAQGLGDVGPTWLAADSYVLTVSGASGSTGTYSFELWSVPDQSTFPISLGTTVADGVPSAGAGNIESPGAQDQYTFSVGGGGARVYLQNLSGSCGCSWSLRSSTGSFEHGFASQGLGDVGPMSLPGGSYVLTVSGSGSGTGTYSFELSAVPAPQSFAISLGTTVADGAPSAGAGNIESPGAEDQYTFSVGGGGARTYLQDLGDSCGCDWSLRTSAGSFVHGFGSQSLADVGTTWLPADSYVLTVSGSGSDTGTYSFKLWSVPAPESFAISLGTTVLPGSPSAGAGNIESPGAQDQYTFSATSGQRVSITGSGCASDPSFVLSAPSGRQLVRDTVCGSNDVFNLPSESGTYRLVVSGGGTDLGTYGFQIAVSASPVTLTLPSADMFAISIGSSVSDGSPAAGAGNIESAGAVDDYAFSGTAGQTIRFDDSGAIARCSLYWQLYAPDGTSLAQAWFTAASGLEVTLPRTGTYEVEVTGSGNATGTYGFSLSTAPTPQLFAISIGGSVSDGNPSAGAGNIESPGSVDEYTFSGTVGQSVRYDDAGTLPCCTIYWQLLASDGTTIAEDWFGDATGQQFTLPTTGQYTFRVNVYDYYYNYYGYCYLYTYCGNATGTYGFSLSAVPAPQGFSMAVGDSVSDGSPSAGEGNIEAVGSVDEYGFTGTAGQHLRFVDAGTAPCCTIYWQVLGPDGGAVAANWFGNTTAQLFTLPASGHYTVHVYGSGTATGTYGFSLLSVPSADVFSIAVGDSVSDGVPAAGAGNIESAGSVDDYTFSGAAGQTVQFADPQTTPCCTLYWQVFAPDGTILAQDWFGNTPGPQFTLPATGQYTIHVYGYNASDTGTYAFSLLQVPLLVPGLTAPISKYISAGQNAVWTIGVQNTSAATLHGVSATLHANGNGPRTFDGSAMPGCSPGSGNSEVCPLADIPAHSTELFSAFVTTNGLPTGTAVTGDVDVSATGAPDTTGLLDTVTISSCGTQCVIAVAAPGVSVSSIPGNPTSTNPTKQILLLPADPAGTHQAIPVTLKSLNSTASGNSAADKTLCPTSGVKCTGQISVFQGNFTKYVDRVHPVQIQVLAHWSSSVPAGHLLMIKDTGGPPVQLPKCVQNSTTHKYNTPCAKAETVTGSAGAGTLTTHDTILFVGTDPHMARRQWSAPNAPTAVKATAGVKRATVQWTAPAITNGSLTGYTITAYVGTAARKTVSFTSLATKETITGLATGTTYTFKVQAKNVHGLSFASIASGATKVK